jgi:hypothetical protein
MVLFILFFLPGLGINKKILVTMILRDKANFILHYLKIITNLKLDQIIQID